ncbi:MAG: hypothetical protein IPL08_04240 [Saprospiraceae bacterium]|nr:hypothetical protein [Saprospiraceae bacterium]
MYIAKSKRIKFRVPNEHWLDEIMVRTFFEKSPKYKIRYIQDLERNIYDLKLDEKISFDFANGRINISFDKINNILLDECYTIAEELGAKYFDFSDKEYPIEKIRSAQEKMAKLDAMRGQEFHTESFGVNNMWIAFEASREEVLWYFDKEQNIVLAGAKYPWEKAISMMHNGEGIFVLEYKKWTFLAGIKTEVLFWCPPSSESISEKCHVSKLLEWGKRFNELQFYQHYDRSTFFNAFYRIHAKEIVYGEYETEFYNKTYGAKPDGIIKMPSNEAYNAAGVWSIDPDTLRFEPELKNAKPWIMNIKQNA